jgi:hypothetical protein
MICCLQAQLQGIICAQTMQGVYFIESAYTYTPSYITHKFPSQKKRVAPWKQRPIPRLFVARKSMSAPRAAHFLTYNKPNLHLGAISQRVRITLNFLICAHDLTLRITKLSRSLQVMYDIKIGMDESGVSISERDAFNYTSQSGWERNFQIGPGYFQ